METMEEKAVILPRQESAVTLRDPEVRKRVRSLMLTGAKIKDIQAELQVTDTQWDTAYYMDVQGFRGFVQSVKKEKMLLDAERVSQRILDMKLGKKNAKLLSIQQKEAEFIRETQGKDLGYSKRIETIGLNINKNEPLDDEQKKKLDNLLKKAGQQTTQEAEVVNSEPVENVEKTI